MRLLSVPLALAFAVLVIGRAPARDDVEGKGKKKPYTIRGRVEAVKKDADKDSGTIAIVIHYRKKGQSGAGEVKHEKFKVTPDTKFEFVQRVGKGQVNRKPATFADVKKGEHVAVVSKEGAREAALRVEILVSNKSGKVPAKKTIQK